MAEQSFNVLTSPWIPLDDEHGHASYVELMSGERDATDLVHPRDDCRFFARMLLSALTQALFPVANAKELRARIASPLSRGEVLRRVEEVKGDFELVGLTAFMQTPLTQAERDNAKSDAETTEVATASLFVDVPRKSRHMLFRPAATCEAVCPPCATLLVYGSQAFAMEEGKSGFGLRGKSPSIRGAPATTTLITLSSVRASAWANVLHGQRPPALSYAPDHDQPWQQVSIDKPKGGSFGLLEGLFWQPRAFHLARGGDGACFACGALGARVAPVAWRSKSRANLGAFYRHPWSPVREDLKTRELTYVRLRSDRPAWASLVDLISPVAGTTERNARPVHAAPVVTQWYESLWGAPASLAILDIGTTKRDRATPASRVCENFSLTLNLNDPNQADAVRALVRCAEQALDALQTACVRLHMKGDGKSPTQRKRARDEKDRLHDMTAAFWQWTEPAFWRAYDVFVADARDDNAWGDAQDACRKAICDCAQQLFDAFASSSLDDPSRVAVAARTRARLRAELPWPSQSQAAGAAA